MAGNSLTRGLLAAVVWAGLAAPATGQPFPTAEPPIAPPPPAVAAPPVNDDRVQPAAFAVPATPPTTAAVAVTPTPVPTLAVNVSVPAVAAKDQELEYRITVENRSQAAAHHVLVRVPEPENSKFVRAEPQPTPSAADPAKPSEHVWSFKTVKANTKHDIVMVVIPTGKGDVKACARVQYEYGECVTTQVGEPQLQVRMKGPSEAVLNEPAPFTVEVSNTGPVEVKDVTLAAVLPAGMEFADAATAPAAGNRREFAVGTVSPGRQVFRQFQATARRAGQHLAQAQVASKAGPRAHTDWSVIATEPRLVVEHSGPKQSYVGQSSPYVIKVRNAGSTRLNNVVLTDTLPPRTALVRASGGGQLFGNKVQWIFPALEPGADQSVTLELRSAEPGNKCNKAEVAADRGQTQQQDACTEFLAAPDVRLETQQSASPVELNGENIYTLTVRNTGSAQTQASVSLAVPAALAVLNSVPPAREQGGAWVFGPVPLDPGASRSFTLRVQARQAGSHSVKVVLSSDALSAPHSEELATVVQGTAPLPEVSRSAVAAPPPVGP